MDPFVGLLVIAIGLAALLAGYRFFRALLPLFGFVVGFVAGAGFIADWLGDGFLQTTLGIVIGLALGLLLAAIAYLWWWWAMVLVITGFGFALGYGILPAIGIDVGFVNFLIGLAVGVAFALAAIVLRLPRAIIIVETSLWGAAAVIAGLLVTFGNATAEELGTGAVLTALGESTIWTIAWIVLALVGMAAQAAVSRDYELQLTEAGFRAAERPPLE